MNRKRSLLRLWAIRLVTHAAAVMPSSRSEWAAAAINETSAVTDDYAALRWALGAVFVSYKERVKHMNFGNLRVSRWILGLEMLLCFLPLTLLAVAVSSAAVTGRMPVFMVILFLSASAIGPIGLAIGFRVVCLQRAYLSGSAILVMIGLASWTSLVFFISLFGFVDTPPVSEWWRQAFLIALLPVVGAAHLAFLGKSSSIQPANI